MRVVLDENVDRRLKRLFDARFEVDTVGERGWSGKKNSELLRLAEQEFNVLVTVDRNLEHQQDLSAFGLGVMLIVAKSNRLSDVELAMPEVNGISGQVRPGELAVVSV
jgi:predicted nuclease of predicted toxin-antitoxin system